MPPQVQCLYGCKAALSVLSQYFYRAGTDSGVVTEACSTKYLSTSRGVGLPTAAEIAEDKGCRRMQLSSIARDQKTRTRHMHDVHVKISCSRWYTDEDAVRLQTCTRNLGFLSKPLAKSLKTSMKPAPMAFLFASGSFKPCVSEQRPSATTLRVNLICPGCNLHPQITRDLMMTIWHLQLLKTLTLTMTSELTTLNLCTLFVTIISSALV